MKYKVLVVTGSRAEYGLLKSTIAGIMSSKILVLQLIVTGMHTLRKYGHTIDDIKKDGIPVSGVVNISESDDMLESLSKEIVGIKNFCLRERPAAILVLGDRDEPFAAAIVGGHLKIPIFHIHGGDVSGYSVDEFIRHSITKFSHLHFTASAKSFNRVLKLGEEKWRTFNVGAPGLDMLQGASCLSRIQLADKLGLDLRKKWIIFVQHPTPLDNIAMRKQITPTLESLSEISGQKIVIFPNNDTGSDIFINEINNYRCNKNFFIFKNFERITYLSLLKHSNLLIGNSSSGIIEAAFFHLPVVNIGNRQLFRECGKNVIHAGYNKMEITVAVKQALSDKFRLICQKVVSPYGAGKAGKKIVKIIEREIANSKLFYKKFTHI